MFYSSSALALVAFTLSVSGHMTMNTPTPYGKHTLQSSPLNNENFQFPCQSGSRADAFDATGAFNPMVAGADQQMKFTGSAVHGGGSCQISITYDYPPPKDRSKWKVIHSMIGSCPTKAVGNLVTSGSDADGRPDGPHCDGPGNECLAPLTYQIPKGMKNGNATLAWTWFNKIGNREMYMNCAPIAISGGSQDDSFFNGLPEIFVANLPGECTTNPGVLEIPNPGLSVSRGEDSLAGAIGTCKAGSAPAVVNPPASSAVSSPAEAAPSKPTQTAPPRNNGGVFAPAASSASSAAPAATPPAAASSPSVNAPSTPLPPVSNESAASGRVSCPTPGQVVCIGSTQFGICNIDHMATVQDLAAGTKCSAGVIGKRDLSLGHSRLHRRHGAGLRLRW